MNILLSERAASDFPLSNFGKGVSLADFQSGSAVDLAVVDGRGLAAKDDREYNLYLAAAAASLPVLLVQTRSDITRELIGDAIAGAVVLIYHDARSVFQAQALVTYEAGVLEAAKVVDTWDKANTYFTLDGGALAAQVQKALLIDTATTAPQAAEAFTIGATATTQAVGTRKPPEVNFSAKVDAYIPTLTWTKLNLKQQVSMHVNLDVHVIAPNNWDAKFIVIRTSGSGISPLLMLKNDEDSRGFFLESVSITYGPWDYFQGPITLQKSTPDNNNNNGTLTKGWTFGVSGSSDKSLSVDYQYSKSTSIPFSDFNVINHINPKKAHWEIKLATIDGDPYEEWTDLVSDWDNDVFPLPVIATNGFQPIMEAVWQLPKDWTGVVPFELYVTAQFRAVHTKFPKKYFDWVSREFTNSFAVDMSLVERPKTTSETMTELEQQIQALTTRVGYLEVETQRQESLINNLDSKLNHLWAEHNRLYLQVNPPRPPILATHKVQAGETLSQIALKYYKSATRDKWMAIYTMNKEEIGDNPRLISVGQELEIPDLY